MIKTDQYGKPMRPKPSRKPVAGPEKAEAMRGLVQELLDRQVVRPCNSEYGSPALVVPKKRIGGKTEWRLVVDFTNLNDVTVRDSFLMPRIESLMHQLHGSTVYSLIDLKNGFWQIRMRPEDLRRRAL